MVALILTFIVLLLINAPIAFVIGGAGMAWFISAGRNLDILAQYVVTQTQSISFLAVPFFIFAGNLMNRTGITKNLISFSRVLTRRMVGGTAQVSVLLSTLMGGVSGSAVADVSSLGSMVIPMMKKQGYDEDFAVGLTVITSCQGVLIPPSHNMVIYALAAGGGVSIGTMFMAGAAPGIVLGLGIMILCFFFAKRYNFPKGNAIPKSEWKKIIIDAILPMMTLVIIMVGTGAGVFTATESSAIACVYTIFLALFVFRSVKVTQIPQIIKNSLKTLAIVMTLLATAKAFAYMMTELRIPAAIANTLLSISTNRYVILLIINVLLLLLGCFMDMAPLITIMTPILLPVVTSVGVDPVHFCVIMIFNLAVGLCTPPVGSALFVGCAIGKTPIERTAKNMLPMYATMVIVLLLVTYVPAVSMTLPRIVMGYGV